MASFTASIRITSTPSMGMLVIDPRYFTLLGFTFRLSISSRRLSALRRARYCYRSYAPATSRPRSLLIQSP
jgi:hypothetical protein